MNTPVLDGRSVEQLRQKVQELARSYTPEWRFEGSEDDPGAALAELFCSMFHQTVERMNRVPDKLFTEFLNLIGFDPPAPVPAAGVMEFTVHDGVEEPVAIPAGTQTFTPDEQGENVVYETVRPMEATPARLVGLYTVDADQDCIQQLEEGPVQPLFARGQGPMLQRHCFSFGQNQALRLACPAQVEVELEQPVRYLEEVTAQQLARPEMAWTFRHGGEQIPFDQVEARGGRILLYKRNGLAMEPDEEGRICITCSGAPKERLVLENVSVRTEPLERLAPERLFAGDVPLDSMEGGYCLGKRPAPYGLFYIGSDDVLSKRGAQVALRLDLAAIVDDTAVIQPDYSFRQAIIDKRDAVAVKPDDVYISAVVWEYFNGRGWRELAVTGDRNPFSCQREGPLEVVFDVPQDLEETEVNAQVGYYIRARVADVENQFSMKPRWVVPFLRGMELTWHYSACVPADYGFAQNHGQAIRLPEAHRLTGWGLEALDPMEPGLRALYLRFDRSPHAMPLSLLFALEGHAKLEDKCLWEAFTGKGFEPVRALDQTGNLHHTGHVFLYLPEPLPRTTLFGQEGCWLRLSRSSAAAGAIPRLRELVLNTVGSVQQQRQEDQYFDTGAYDAGKELQLLAWPVLDCQVWVEESATLAPEEARQMEEQTPQDVEILWEGRELAQCWVRWPCVADLSLAGPQQRACQLDAYTGQIRFGDGRAGRVPPAGDHNIRVQYKSGGGQRGNRPAGRVDALLGALPNISGVRNRTPMSGGTGRFSQERIEALGNKRLRHRGRAVGRRDYEELVAEAFPQVYHVRCFTGLDQSGQRAPGHVTVVVAQQDEGAQAVEELCGRIRHYLEQRSPCCLVEEGRLHVRPALLMTIHTRVEVEMEDLDRAADTQQQIADRMERLIGEQWRSRPIGSQIALGEVWRTVRETPNVRLVRQVLVEGTYDQGGQTRIIPLENRTELPFAVVRSGSHLVRVR